MNRWVFIWFLVFTCASYAQVVDYDDLYFDSTDREILKRKNKKKKKQKSAQLKTYLPSEHQDYTYYSQYKKPKEQNQIVSISLSCMYLIPKKVNYWMLYRLKNIHLVYPNLAAAFSYKYQTSIDRYPFAYVDRKDFSVHVFLQIEPVSFILMR